MNIKKSILKEYIKAKVRMLLSEEAKVDDVKAMADVKKTLYLIDRLPPLKRALVTLLTKAYDQYITDVKLEAPKPSTFKVSLINGIEFYLIYSGGKDNAKFDLVNGTFYATIAGKKYDLLSTSQSEQAAAKLAKQLTLSPAAPDEIAPKSDKGEEAFNSGGGGGSFSGGSGSTGAEEMGGGLGGDEGGEGGPEPNVIGQAAPPSQLNIPQPELNVTPPEEET